MVITGWGAFWIFLTVYFVFDTWMFLKGYNTAFWHYKTDAEKQIQQILIDKMKDKNGP